MAKKIFYEAEARAKVLAGAKQLYDAVKVTFGPKGQNVVIEKSYGGPTITHDGVTVAEAVDLGSTDETLANKSAPSSSNLPLRNLIKLQAMVPLQLQS